MSETIVAAYDTPEHAEQTIADLLAAHVPEASIHRHTRSGDDLTTEVPIMVHKQGAGFWASLFGVDTGDDHLAYDMTLEGGGTVVRVTMIPDQDYDVVLEILARHHPIDLDAHGAEHGVGSLAVDGSTRVPEGPAQRGTPQVRHYIAQKPDLPSD